MRTFSVDLGSRSYEIRIGSNLINRAEAWSGIEISQQILVVTNSTLANLHLTGIESILRDRASKVGVCILEDGEQYKNLSVLEEIYSKLLASGLDRSVTVIAFGGGVVGDITGFAAATYQRGVPFIQIPTTLLAQVDSSVGGKTGINHPLGKNMIGAFWQPKRVIIDTALLRTLPDREFSSGMAEVIKYGLIRDPHFLEWLEASMPSLMAKDPEALEFAIERSCQNKAAVVADDEFETAKEGGRALLNLGHTFGHAIENGMGYGTWLHGEAVAAGTVMAAELSRRLGWLKDSDCERIRNLLNAAKLPTQGPDMGVDKYLELMARDKKVMHGRLRLVLLKRLGEAVTYPEAPEAEIRAAIEACCRG